MAIVFYPAIVERGGDDLFAFFPDLPGCTVAGRTLAELGTNAEEVLASHIELAARQGETVPAPSTMDEIECDPDVEEVARILVKVERP